jgi:hypothetical protein
MHELGIVCVCVHTCMCVITHLIPKNGTYDGYDHAPAKTVMLDKCCFHFHIMRVACNASLEVVLRFL